MQKIAALTWARNEEDILEDFVRHTMEYVDHMIVVLHRCTDASQEILEMLQKEGFPLEIREDDSPVHRQSAALTELMHEQDADWILPLDADEFLAGNLDALVEFPRESVTLLPWKTYVPTVLDDAREPRVQQRITHRKSFEQPQFYKVLVPQTITRDHGITLLEGNHIVVDRSGTPLASTKTDALWLAHFPVRSASQLRAKICNGWESHRINPERKPGQAFHWELLYERCKDAAHILPEELQNIALRYATADSSLPTPQALHDPIIS